MPQRETSAGDDADVLLAAEWCRENPESVERYVGEWVAIGPKGIIAHHCNLQEVSLAAAKANVRTPLFYKVPPKGMTAFWWNCG